MHRWRWFAVALSQLACGTDDLVTLVPRIEGPGRIDLGAAWVGYETSAAVQFRNTGTAAGCAEIEAALEVRPREFCLQAGEAASVEMGWLPQAPGPLTASFRVRRGKALPLDVELVGMAQVPPACDAARPCHAMEFDPRAGACTESALPDGSACDAGACMGSGVCLAGTCRGEFACDDGNACTVDVCGPAGCATLGPTSACPTTDDPCLLPVCADGECGQAPAPDGQECAPSDCLRRFECQAGACVATDAETDGASCVGACGQGQCLAGRCNEPLPKTAELLFSHDPQPHARLVWADPPLVVDADGTAFWLEQNDTKHYLVSARIGGAVRRRPIDLGSAANWPRRLLVTAGVVVVSADGSAQGFRASDGKRIWTHDPLHPTVRAQCVSHSIWQELLGTRLATTSDGRIVVGSWCTAPDAEQLYALSVLDPVGEPYARREGKGQLFSLLVDAADRILIFGTMEDDAGVDDGITVIRSTQGSEAIAEGKHVRVGCGIVDIDTGVELREDGAGGQWPCGHVALFSGHAAISVRGRVTARSLDTGRILWSRPLEAPDAIGAWGVNVLATSRGTALVVHGDTPCYVGPCHRGVLEELDLTGQTIRSCAIPENLQVTPYALRGGAVWGIAQIGQVGHFGRVVALGLPGADEWQQGWVTPWGGGAGERRER